MTCTNEHDCPCTFNCAKHGRCCDCIAHHNSKGQFPACMFSKEAEKEGDRSLARLIADRS